MLFESTHRHNINIMVKNNAHPQVIYRCQLSLSCAWETKICDVREATVELHCDDVLVCNIYAIVLGENNYGGGKIMISTIKPAPN